MTKEEILNGMSEEEFYDMYPTPEDWENAQQMKLGGLSGAPHDGQPTADQFFSYGSHVNDAVNVPMSNPLYLANGGTPYYGGPIRPYQTGGYKPAPNPDKYFNQQDAALDYPAKGSNVNIDYSKVTKQGPALAQYTTTELNNMGANIPVPNPAQDARFAKIAAYNKEHPYIPAGGNLFKKSDGSEGRFTYTKGAYTPFPATPNQPLVNNAYGGYMDMGGNTASPTNYGAFNVPMQAGGVLDPGNNQQYPILEDGGKANLMAIIKAHSKKMKKAYREGGDTVMQGGNSDDYPTSLTNTFKNVLKQNMYNHMINEEEQAFAKEFMQMGGYQGQGMNYNTTTFNEKNPQNAAMQDMYSKRQESLDSNFQNNIGNFSNAMYDLKATANPYTKTTVKADKDFKFNQDTQNPQTVKAGVGLETGNPRTMSQEEWAWFDQQRKAKENEANYNKYFKGNVKENNSSYLNYNPYNKISRKDVAMMQQLAKNPTTNLKEFKHSHFGPWGRTKMTFGYKDLYEDNMKVKEVPTSLKNKKNKNQTKDLGPYPDATEYDGVLDNYQHGELFPKVYKPGMSPADFMPSNLQGTPSIPSTTPVDVRSYDWENKIGFPAEKKPTMLDIPKKYGGGLKKYQGNVSGSQVGFDPNDKTPIKMEPISALPAFSNSINEQGIKLKEQQSHLKDPTTGSMYGPEKQASITTKQKPGYNGMAAASAIVAGIDTATSAINRAKDKSGQGLADLQLADNAFLSTPANAQSKGDYDPNSGMFRPNQMVPVQFAGYSAYGGSFQEGGAPDQAQPDPQQVMEGVAQMLQQGAQPEQIAQQLVQMGIPQEQVMQIIQTVMQQLQGGQQEQPPMRYGGYAMGGYQDDEESYEDDLDEDEIAELKRQGYNVEYLD